MQISILIINALFTIFMLALFVWDYKSFGTPTHKDFKSIIMSSGVLGTFVGIFVGLFSFDTLHLESSVPLLLDGLKTAFYTSILGMGEAIVLSVLQKSKHIKSDEESNLDYIARQVSFLENLRFLPTLEKLPSSESLHALFERNHAMIESRFQEISHSLQQATSEFAKGASKELISALENVIKDFNANLQNQFGENFKELNSAVGKLLTWQEEYKEFIYDTQSLLKDTQKALQKSQLAVQNTQKSLHIITEQNTQVQEFYANNLKLLESFEVQNQKLHAHLEQIAGLKENSFACLNTLRDFFINAKNEGAQLGENITRFNQSLSAQILQIAQTLEENFKLSAQNVAQSAQIHFAKIDKNMQGHTDALLNLTKESMQNLKSFSKDMLATNTQSLQQIHADSLQSLKEGFSALSVESAKGFKILADNAKQSLDSLFSQIQALLLKQDEASNKAHELHLQNLNEMRALNLDFKNNHEQITKLLSQSFDTLAQNLANQTSKLLSSQSSAFESLAADSKNALQKEQEKLSKYIKALALEYLKVLQKLTKESLSAPKSTSEQILLGFKEFQENMLSQMLSTQTHLAQNAKQTQELFLGMQDSLKNSIDGNATLSSQLENSLKNLDEAMSVSVENFWKNYEWFLERIKELIGARR
ncbi:hypothetical protein CQA49_05555 [Helicobacter sp. MIT 00-7814]|uniref:hypothetical protein n=1 Tax=unclassified Helicobacter TaxID=2593540 RepID=UPI000E1F1212|nr:MULTISPECIES: hypothetical protein [unclassified Helicobacter]RDU53690.1 hypothetical protein CQA37_06700 [Helicobacter sp. MIT 99-10781]RDU54076.1 hypothetical protein CQA49_05555 [Helicobacter sp. MIT 00-7814]